MTVRKSRIIILFVMLLFVFLPVRAMETVVTDNGYQIVIRDDAGLLSDSEEKKLIEDMRPITEYGNVAFVSGSVYSMETSTYAKQVYKELFGETSGMVFVIDMGNRNIWIYSQDDVYKVINRGYANTITDNIYTYATKGEYYECARQAYEQAYTLLEGGRIAQPMKYITNALFALITAVLLNYFLVASTRKRTRAEEPEIFGAITASIAASVAAVKMISSRKYYRPESSGGSSGGGGGSSGGGSSGGGGGHSF